MHIKIKGLSEPLLTVDVCNCFKRFLVTLPYPCQPIKNAWSVPVTKSLSMDWYWIGMGRYTSVLLAVS